MRDYDSPDFHEPGVEARLYADYIRTEYDPDKMFCRYCRWWTEQQGDLGYCEIDEDTTDCSWWCDLWTPEKEAD